MKRTKLPAVVGILLLVGGGTYGYLEYDRGVASTAPLPVKVSVTADRLLKDFQTSESIATQKYAAGSDQAVQVTGTIRNMEPVGAGITNVMLETGDELAAVVCEFKNKDLPVDWRPGAQVSIKGVCTGMLIDVVLVRCVAGQ